VNSVSSSCDDVIQLLMSAIAVGSQKSLNTSSLKCSNGFEDICWRDLDNWTTKIRDKMTQNVTVPDGTECCVVCVVCCPMSDTCTCLRFLIFKKFSIFNDSKLKLTRSDRFAVSAGRWSER
jgi:hypothetical protein